MALTNLGLIAIIIYTVWKSFTTLNGLITAMYTEKRLKLIPVLEIVYTIYMIYLLVTVSRLFLLLAAIAFIVQLGIGIFVELFHPETSLSKEKYNNALASYWLYIIFDTSLTLISYAVVSI